MIEWFIGVIVIFIIELTALHIIWEKKYSGLVESADKFGLMATALAFALAWPISIPTAFAIASTIVTLFLLYRGTKWLANQIMKTSVMRGGE